jgi:hypothetical protein
MYKLFYVRVAIDILVPVSLQLISRTRSDIMETALLLVGKLKSRTLGGKVGGESADEVRVRKVITIMSEYENFVRWFVQHVVTLALSLAT